MTAYDRDLHGWAHEQAQALRARSANEVDWENVAEEIESLGKQEAAQLESRLEVLILHLLKWAYQPERQGRSWRNTIREQRRRIARHLGRNPSLAPLRDEIFADAYQDARFSASKEITGEPDPDLFPDTAPFGIEQALCDDWLPDAVAASEAPTAPEPPR